jgi:hypothetical protein
MFSLLQDAHAIGKIDKHVCCPVRRILLLDIEDLLVTVPLIGGDVAFKDYRQAISFTQMRETTTPIVRFMSLFSVTSLVGRCHLFLLC